VQLRNVLRAYAFRNPMVGYTQGMNLLVARFLLFCGEEDRFLVFFFFLFLLTAKKFLFALFCD
jgi:hypothetical protein